MYASGINTLRGINGSLQWLVSNTRVDLAAKVSLSASEAANPTISSLQKANKLIRQAQRDDTLPIHIPAITMDELNFGIFSDAAWGVRPDGSSQGGFLFFSTSSFLLARRSLSSCLAVLTLTFIAERTWSSTGNGGKSSSRFKVRHIRL